jgi:uncharacterized lipoprotein YmbA
MLPQILFRLAAPTLGLCLMALGGCASTQAARFYVLSALPGGGTASPGAAAERGLAIGVGPVTLPKYLDRPQIVTFTSPYALNVAEFDRWAEPLESTFVRVLAENLALLLPTARLLVFPWPGSTRLDHQVTVEVSDFSGQLGGESSLMARWSLLRGEGQEALVSRRSRFRAPAGAPGYEAMVAAMSQTVADLSRDIAAAITTRRPQMSAR